MIQFILKKSLLFAVAWTVVIFILCSTPGKYIPTTSWLELLSFDKFVHASIFFVLSLLWLLTVTYYKKTTTISILLILTCCVAYGGLLEIMQATLFSQRSGDWVDFIANTFGCLVAVFLYYKKEKFALFYEPKS